MKKELEFRAWDFKEKQMKYGFKVGKFFTSYNCDEFMQFIGLLDKDNRKIYEGDIVKIDSRIGVVEYSLYLNLCEYRLFLIEDFNNKGDWCRGTFEFDDSIRMKVIGNIFENPELLVSK